MTTFIGKIKPIYIRGWLAKAFIRHTAKCDTWLPRYDASGEIYMWIRERE